MRAFSSNLAQIVTAVAATIALLYFFRGVLAPFFLALVIMVVIHAIADVTVGLLPKAPRWIVMVLTAVVLGALIIASFDIALHGLEELIPQTQHTALRLQELLQNAGSAVGVAEVPNLKVLLGAADLSGLVQRTLASMTGALSSVGLVILFVAFLLASRPTINSKIAIVAASSSREKGFNAVVKEVDRGVRDCVLAQTMSAGLIAGGAGVVMLTIGLENALFWAIVIFLISYIPVVGGLVSSIAPALFAGAVSDHLAGSDDIFGDPIHQHRRRQLRDTQNAGLQTKHRSCHWHAGVQHLEPALGYPWRDLGLSADPHADDCFCAIRNDPMGRGVDLE